MMLLWVAFLLLLFFLDNKSIKSSDSKVISYNSERVWSYMSGMLVSHFFKRVHLLLIYSQIAYWWWKYSVKNMNNKFINYLSSLHTLHTYDALIETSMNSDKIVYYSNMFYVFMINISDWTISLYLWIRFDLSHIFAYWLDLHIELLTRAHNKFYLVKKCLRLSGIRSSIFQCCII